jgi:hypothetical protein
MVRIKALRHQGSVAFEPNGRCAPFYHQEVVEPIDEANKINILFIGPRRDVYERLRELITGK